MSSSGSYKPWQVALTLVGALGIGALCLWMRFNPETQARIEATDKARRSAAERERDAEVKKKALEEHRLEAGPQSTRSSPDGYLDYHGGYPSYDYVADDDGDGPQCKRGKRCGNSCISVDKTCHK
jgi:hypothetical protein